MSDTARERRTSPLLLAFVGGGLGCGAAFACVACATIAIVWVLRRDAIEQCRPDGLVRAVVAVRTLDAAVAIESGDVEVRMLYAADVPKEGTFAASEDVVGRIPGERILPNELVRSERLTAP